MMDCYGEINKWFCAQGQAPNPIPSWVGWTVGLLIVVCIVGLLLSRRKPGRSWTEGPGDQMADLPPDQPEPYAGAEATPPVSVRTHGRSAPRYLPPPKKALPEGSTPVEVGIFVGKEWAPLGHEMERK